MENSQSTSQDTEDANNSAPNPQTTFKPTTDPTDDAAATTDTSPTVTQDIATPNTAPAAAQPTQTTSTYTGPTTPPVNPLAINTAPTSPMPAKKHFPVLVLALIVAVVFVAAAAAGGYFLGKQKVTAKAVTAPKIDAPLTPPTDATIISQCAVGRGTQYALPKDIPLGPVYNVYEGKVIGIEFMAGKDALLTQNQSFLDLPLRAQKYDHVNIGLLSQGHAGFPSPHYHVDIMMVSKAETDKITCKK